MSSLRLATKSKIFTCATCGVVMLLMPCSCAPATVTVTLTLTATPTDPYDLSYLIELDPAVVDNSGLPVTPLERMHVIGTPPEVDINAYNFTVTGLVDVPLNLSYGELKAFPAEDRVALLICPRTFADNARWAGIPLPVILAAAGVKAEATEIVLQSIDGFEIPLPVEIAPDILLAHEVDGRALPPGHGYPLRAVVEGRIGLYWLRWLKGIQIR